MPMPHAHAHALAHAADTASTAIVVHLGAPTHAAIDGATDCAIAVTTTTAIAATTTMHATMFAVDVRLAPTHHLRVRRHIPTPAPACQCHARSHFHH